MTYRVVMAALSPGRDCQGIAGAAITLARQFDAMLLARAYCRPIHCICGDYSVPAALFQEDRRQIERHLKASETDFRAIAAKNDHTADWQGESSTEPLSERLARESAAADIVVASVPKMGEPHDATRQPDLCELVMQAGRPVVLVPEGSRTAKFERILVAWKDTREARRAVRDALPLLAKARNVLIVEIHAVDEHAAAWQSVARVSRWLARHGIAAEEKVVAAEMANASQLSGLAQAYDADVIVAGAYGHNRQGRWTLGGITSELLSGGRCVLLSH
jgi:nucleotide-binding universal stress UspA family protein